LQKVHLGFLLTQQQSVCAIFQMNPCTWLSNLLFVGMDGVQDALVLLAEQCYAGPEPELRLSQVQAFTVHGDVVAVGPGNQPVHALMCTGWAACPSVAPVIASRISASKSMPTAR